MYTLVQGALGLGGRGELRYLGGVMFFGLGFGGFGIYLEGLLYTWRRLLPYVGLMPLEACSMMP